MTTVERLKKLLKERDIPISRLEKDCGFANGYISQLRKGTIPDNRLKKISEYLNISVAELMGVDTPNTEFSLKDLEFTLKFQKLNKEQQSLIMSTIDQLLALNN